MFDEVLRLVMIVQLSSQPTMMKAIFSSVVLLAIQGANANRFNTTMLQSGQVCDVKDFTAQTPVSNAVSPEACSDDNCKWWLVTRYANCDDFCEANGLECVGAQELPGGHGCPLEGEEFPEISCSAGSGGAGFHRTCTCAVPADYRKCDLKDFTSQTPVSNAVAPESCSGDDCNWWLVTRYASCNDFCEDNGLVCAGARDLPGGHGCPGFGDDFPEISCDAGSGGAGFHRTCKCEHPPEYKKCEITDFSAQTPANALAPESCSGDDCKWWLVTRYATCDDFCQANDLVCVGAQDLPGAHGCPGFGESFPEISCSAGGGGAGFHRTCTCAHP